jgi:hypothetical protein
MAPKRKRQEVLAMLADSPDGCTDAALLASGFTVRLIIELIYAGLAMAELERIPVGHREVEVARVTITEAGRRELERTKP